jgi:hypothetical protein
MWRGRARRWTAHLLRALLEVAAAPTPQRLRAHTASANKETSQHNAGGVAARGKAGAGQGGAMRGGLERVLPVASRRLCAARGRPRPAGIAWAAARRTPNSKLRVPAACACASTQASAAPVSGRAVCVRAQGEWRGCLRQTPPALIDVRVKLRAVEVAAQRVVVDVDAVNRSVTPMQKLTAVASRTGELRCASMAETRCAALACVGAPIEVPRHGGEWPQEKK